MFIWTRKTAETIANLVDKVDAAAGLTGPQERANAAAAAYDETQKTLAPMMQAQIRSLFVGTALTFAGLFVIAPAAFIGVPVMLAGAVWAARAITSHDEMRKVKMMVESKALRCADGVAPQFSEADKSPQVIRNQRRLKAIFAGSTADAEFEDLKENMAQMTATPKARPAAT